jgi:hypothetical protein
MSFHINHNPHVRRRIISIDSRFRDPVYSSASNFVYNLAFPIRNVISVRLSSIEYPNTYFVFSEMKGNVTMKLKFSATPWLTIQIPDGNYTTIPGDPSSLLFTIQTAIRTAYQPYVTSTTIPDPVITVSVSPTTGHVTIQSTGATPLPFTMDFRGGKFDQRSYDWGLGYNLGFANKEYPIASTSFTGSAIIDIVGAAYIFLTLNGIEPIQHYSPEKNVFSAFAKLLMVGDKNSIVYDDGSSFITKEYVYQQPVDFFVIHPMLVDTYGEIVDLNGKNYSFTLELEEIINVSAYKQYRDNLLSEAKDWQPTYNV